MFQTKDLINHLLMFFFLQMNGWLIGKINCSNHRKDFFVAGRKQQIFLMWLIETHLSKHACCNAYYSGRETPSHKMGSVFFCFFFEDVLQALSYIVLSFFVLLYATQKAQKNLTFVLNKSHSVQ